MIILCLLFVAGLSLGIMSWRMALSVVLIGATSVLIGKISYTPLWVPALLLGWAMILLIGRTIEEAREK